MENRMKGWMWCVLVTVVCWGAYVPMIHHGAKAFHSGQGSFRAFLFVGLAYFLMAGAILLYLAATRREPLDMTANGVVVSTVAGLLGAIGALGVIFAVNRFGGRPLLVAPLVFAGAPMVNTAMSMIWDKPAKAPGVLFYVGVLLAAVGAGLVLRFRPT
jgi:drug/metabolite transporter (DMT)-like permease